MPAAETALEKLLTDLFSDVELRRFIQSLDDGDALSAGLPGPGVPLATLVYETVRLLSRRGEVDQGFFEALAAAAGKKAPAVVDVAKLWGFTIIPPAPVPVPAPVPAPAPDPPPPDAKVIKILFLASNPSDTARLALDREFRGIQQRIQMSTLRDRFQLTVALAVRTVDLTQELLTQKPTIVHFAGHGDNQGLFLEGEGGNAVRVPKDALASLFGLLPSVRCVVLNVCYSEDQASAIARSIPIVVGMDGAVIDQAGILFADGFYQALANGRNVKDAVNLGRVAYEINGIQGSALPRIKTHKGVAASTFTLT